MAEHTLTGQKAHMTWSKQSMLSVWQSVSTVEPDNFPLTFARVVPTCTGGNQDNQQEKDGADEHAREDPKRDPDPAAATLDQMGRTCSP